MGVRLAPAQQASLDRMGAPRQKINSGVRTDPEQAEFFRKNYTSDYARSSKRDERVWNGVTYWRKAPYDKHVMVAVPGTSNHQDPPGVAMDVDTSSKLHAHLLKHGAAHGWHRPLMPPHVRERDAEPWHWEYDSNRDQHLTVVRPEVATPEPLAEAEVLIFKATSDSKSGLIPAGMSFIQGPSGPMRPLSAAEFEAYKFYNDRGVPARIAEWEGDAIEPIANTVGLLEWDGIPGNVPQLTGRVIRYGKVVTESAGTVDVDAIAQQVADVLAQRLKG